MIGRNTQGVRVMRLKDSEVATVAIAPREEDEDGETQNEPTEAENAEAVPEAASSEEPNGNIEE